MAHYTYVIVGGGMTADAAVRAIRASDGSGTIAMFSLESDPPYDRPPLSKGLWKGRPVEKLWRKTQSHAVDLHLNRRIVSLDPNNKTVSDEQGNSYGFDKLLLATGAKPRRLPFGGDQVIYYRTLVDYRRLRQLTEHHERFAVIGGGFIGSEVAAALAMTGKKATLVFPEDGIGWRLYPPDLSRFLNRFYGEKGVAVRSGQMLSAIEQRSSGLVLKLSDAKTKQESDVVVDAVVAGIGVEPEVTLAQAAGLPVDNGIIVDSMLRTTHPDIYAAGDVASFYSPVLGRRMRVEHEDNANTMGAAAGRAMAGEPAEYTHLPFFYSDLFELGYEAVGDLDPRLETIVDWKELHREGVVYYMKEGRVRGVLLWNVWKQVDAARRLIAEPGPFTAVDLKRRLQ